MQDAWRGFPPLPRLLLVLEGGYHVPSLCESVVASVEVRGRTACE